MSDTCQYVRDCYGIPAEIGRRVLMDLRIFGARIATKLGGTKRGHREQHRPFSS